MDSRYTLALQSVSSLQRNSGLVLVLATAIIKHDKSGMAWPPAEVWARMVLSVLFAVADSE
jgi:hypothetical protein